MMPNLSHSSCKIGDQTRNVSLFRKKNTQTPARCQQLLLNTEADTHVENDVLARLFRAEARFITKGRAYSPRRGPLKNLSSQRRITGGCCTNCASCSDEMGVHNSQLLEYASICKAYQYHSTIMSVIMSQPVGEILPAYRFSGIL